MSLQTILIQTINIEYKVKSGEQILTILEDINVTIRSGISIAIIGASGSGKTSLLNILAGLALPTSGKIFHLQKETTNWNEDQRAALRASNLSFIFQSFHLLPNLTAFENVMLPLEIHQVKHAKEIALEWLNQLGLGARIAHYPGQLSGGEQQRVAIARAFSTSPKILFADEPTGNLDEETGHHMIDLLFKLNTIHQTTLVIVTHDELLAKRCALKWTLSHGLLTC